MPDAVVEQVLAHTDGVPLFLEELTSTLLESGLLRETPDRYVLDGPLPPLAIPTTLQASLVARLDRLGPVKNVAQIAAAIGRQFTYELIFAVSALAPMDLDAALQRLTASGLISRRGMPPDATYSFKHALVQDAAYATMLKSRRRQLHASIAKVLVERFPAMAESLPEVVAHHFTEAGLATEAIAYWLKAGRLASARSANREAVKSFEQALHLLEAQPESQSTLEQGCDLRVELRSVLAQLGEGQRMLEYLREAEALAERLNDDRRRCRVYAFMTMNQSNVGELDEALVSGSRALEISGRLGDLGLRILATGFLEVAHYTRGEYDRVIELATGNLAAVPAESVYENFGHFGPASVWDRAWLVMSLAELGQFAEAAKYAAEAIHLAEPTQHPFTISMAHFAAGVLHLLKGDWVQARSLIERWVAVARTGHLILHHPWAVASSAWALAQLGEASEALNRLREGERSSSIRPRGESCASRLGLPRAGSRWSAARPARRSAAPGRPRGRSLSFEPRLAPLALHLLGDIADPSRPLRRQGGEAHYRQALALAEPPAAPPRRPLPPRPRQALPAHGQAAGGAGAPRDGDDDVPRHGHDVLAGAGGGGDASAAVVVADFAERRRSRNKTWMPG